MINIARPTAPDIISKCFMNKPTKYRGKLYRLLSHKPILNETCHMPITHVSTPIADSVILLAVIQIVMRVLSKY